MTTEIEEQQDAAKWASETPTDKLIHSYKVWQETIAQGKMRLAAIEHELTARMGQNAVLAGDEWMVEREPAKRTYSYRDEERMIEALVDVGVPDFMVSEAIETIEVPAHTEYKPNRTKLNALARKFPDVQYTIDRYTEVTERPGPLKVRRIDGV